MGDKDSSRCRIMNQALHHSLVVPVRKKVCIPSGCWAISFQIMPQVEVLVRFEERAAFKILRPLSRRRELNLNWQLFMWLRPLQLYRVNWLDGGFCLLIFLVLRDLYKRVIPTCLNVLWSSLLIEHVIIVGASFAIFLLFLTFRRVFEQYRLILAVQPMIGRNAMQRILIDQI